MYCKFYPFSLFLSDNFLKFLLFGVEFTAFESIPVQELAIFHSPNR